MRPAVGTKLLDTPIPSSLAQRLEELAKRLECSPDALVEEALTHWVELQEKRHLLTVEALADVDHGRVIDHQAVEAWADSLDTDKPLPMPR